MLKYKYNELSTVNVSKNTNIVISECIRNSEPYGYTLAQQVELDEGDKKIKVFMKGAIHIKDIDCLYNLRDAVTHAIDKIEDFR
jgi:hypothetical protein